MSRCLENDVVPNGLQLQLEPTIGNFDDEFLNKWHTKLKEYSKDFMKDVIEFCERTQIETDNHINKVTKELKDNIGEQQFTPIEKQIAENNESRKRTLKQKKTKKFFALKYRNNNQSSFRENMEQPPATNHSEQNATYANVVSQQDQRRVTQGQAPQINQRESYRRYEERNQNQWQQARRKPSNNNLSRQSSNTDVEETLTERISLRRRRSNTNLANRNQNTNNTNANFVNQNNSAHAVNQNNTGNNRNMNVDKTSQMQEQINALQTELNQMKTGKNNTNEQPTSSKNPQNNNQEVEATKTTFAAPINSCNQTQTQRTSPETPKNELRVRSTEMDSDIEPNEIIGFIANAMETLRSLEARYKKQLNTRLIHSDQ